MIAVILLVVTSFGFYMWPYFSANSFSAKNNDVLRHKIGVALVANSIVFVVVSMLTANVKANQSGSAIMKNS